MVHAQFSKSGTRQISYRKWPRVVLEDVFEVQRGILRRRKADQVRSLPQAEEKN